MNASVFSAKTVKEALRKVRDVLGPDAVIISETRRQGIVEITASVEYPQGGEAPKVRRTGVAGEYVERMRALGFDAAFIDTVTSTIDLTAVGKRRTADRRIIGVAPRDGDAAARAHPADRAAGFGQDDVGDPSGRESRAALTASTRSRSSAQDVNRLAGCEQLQLAASCCGCRSTKPTTNAACALRSRKRPARRW